MADETQEQLSAQTELQAAIEKCAAAYGFSTDGQVADYLVVFAYQKIDEDGDVVERIDQITSPVATLRSVSGMLVFLDESVRSQVRGSWE